MVPSPHTCHLLKANIVWLLLRDQSSVLNPGLAHFVAVPLTVYLTHACQTARRHIFRFRFHLFAFAENNVAGLLGLRRAILVQSLLLIALSHSGLTLSRGLSPPYAMPQMMTRLRLCLPLRYLRRLLALRYLFQVPPKALHLLLNPLPFGVARGCSLPLR